MSCLLCHLLPSRTMPTCPLECPEGGKGQVSREVVCDSTDGLFLNCYTSFPILLLVDIAVANPSHARPSCHLATLHLGSGALCKFKLIQWLSSACWAMRLKDVHLSKEEEISGAASTMHISEKFHEHNNTLLRFVLHTTIDFSKHTSSYSGVVAAPRWPSQLDNSWVM